MDWPASHSRSLLNMNKWLAHRDFRKEELPFSQEFYEYPDCSGSDITKYLKMIERCGVENQR